MFTRSLRSATINHYRVGLLNHNVRLQYELSAICNRILSKCLESESQRFKDLKIIYVTDLKPAPWV